MGEMALDTVIFDECVKGMQQLPESAIDLVIADPPFGIDFNGKSFGHAGACPECGGTLVHDSGCNVCRDCGYSQCE